jgi:DNA-binding response OmpR family regulator
MTARILVIDDESLIALDMSQQLSDAGYEIVGPATTIARALELLRTTGCDAAVLDVRLGNETSEAVANELRSIGKPFVVLTGYASDSLRAEFGNAPVLCKPARSDVLTSTVTKLLKNGSSGPSVCT